MAGSIRNSLDEAFHRWAQFEKGTIMAKGTRRKKTRRKRDQALERKLITRRHQLLDILRAEAVLRETGGIRELADLADMASDALEQDIYFRIA